MFFQSFLLYNELKAYKNNIFKTIWIKFFQGKVNQYRGFKPFKHIILYILPSG